MTDNAQQKAHTKYEAKRVLKNISFNTEKDAHLLNKIDEIQASTGLSFSEWVKKQIEQA